MTTSITSLRQNLPISRLAMSEGAWTAVAITLGLLFWAVTTWIPSAEYTTYNSTARDLAVYLQAIWNTAHGQPFATTLLEHNRIHLAEHVALLIPLIAPIYSLLPDPRLLFAIQQAVIVLSGVPVFLFASRSLGPGWATLVFACFLAMPTVTEVALDAFYPVVFTALPLSFAAYFSLTGRFKLAAIMGMIALPIEEEAGLVAFGIGIFMLAVKRRLGWGGLLSTVAALWMVLTTAVIMPRFHDPTTLPATANRTTGHFEQLRENPVAVLTTVVQNRLPPTMEWLLLPTGGIALLAPEILLIAAPELGTLLFADREGRFRRHWIAPVLPIIWLAVVGALVRLQSPTRRRIGAAVLVAGTVFSYAIDSSLPGGGDYEALDTVWSSRAEQIERVLKEVPSQAVVASSRRSLPYLANRPSVYVYPPSYAGDLWPVSPMPDYYALDLTNDQTREALGGRSSPLRASPSPVLWTTGPDAALLLPSAPSLPRSSDLVFDWVQLRNWDLQPTQSGQEVTLLWESTRRPARAQSRSVQILDGSGAIIFSLDGHPMDSVFPTTEWQRGQIWVDRVLIPDTIDVSRARLKAGWGDRGRSNSSPVDVGPLTQTAS